MPAKILRIRLFNLASTRLMRCWDRPEMRSLKFHNDANVKFKPLQHIDVDLSRLTKLLTEAIAKFRLLKKGAQLALMNSLEKAIWNWMDNYRKPLKPVIKLN